MSYLVDALRQPFHIYLLPTNPILLVDSIMVLLRIVQKSCRCF